MNDRRAVVAFFVLIAACLLVSNATTPLWEQDEAAYAGFARNMLVHHQWAVPSFPYSQVHRKTPLSFWAIAGSFALLGINEFALRLPSVLAIAGTIACTWFGARFILGRQTAKLAAMMLAAMPFVLTLGKIALTDGLLLFFETVAALALLRGATRPSWVATVILWCAVAAGVLTKGPPILIVVGLMFCFLLIVHRRRRNLVHLHPWFGLPLALLPTAVWGFIAWHQDPGYVVFFVWWYMLRRVGYTIYGQGGPPGTFFVLFLITLMPWTGYFLTALAGAWRDLRRRRMAIVLLGSWLFGAWLFWELPPSKLPTYVLGAIPALVLLLAKQVRMNLAGRTTWRTHRSLRAGFHAQVGVCVVLAAVILVVGIWRGAMWAKPLSVIPAAVVLAIGFLAVHFQRQGRPLATLRTLMLGGPLVHLLAWTIIVPGLTHRWAAAPEIAQIVARECVPGTTVVAVKRMSSPALPFYVQQAGLQFREVLDSTEQSPPLHIDTALLWRLDIPAIKAEVEAQTPRKPSPAEEDSRLRAQRARELLATGGPVALVLDEDQYDALRSELAGARIVRISGWQMDRLDPTTYVLAMPPAAVTHAATRPHGP